MENECGKIRFHLIDDLRGLMIIGVVLFHFAFDLYAVGFSWAEQIVYSTAFEAVATVGRVLFVLIAGICSRLSRSNIKRGLITLGAAAVISIATAGLDLIMLGSIGNMFIYCGILHLLGFCMLLYGLMELVLKKINISLSISLVLAMLCCILFVFTFNIWGYGIGFFNWNIQLDRTAFTESVFGTLLGFGGFPILSADYFPLMPWAFMFFAGVAIGAWFKADRVPKLLHRELCSPLGYIGKKTLWIYLLHQPLVYGVAILIRYIVAL